MGAELGGDFYDNISQAMDLWNRKAKMERAKFSAILRNKHKK
ncbi:hypothetical protein [Photorhabdus heterorhabditis]|nr:hypothetical protein [Photorhabdus heterorhabditis]